MSLITQCPACTTMFKVVPDQLRVSEGWVRCGQCDEVFDANARLQAPLAAPSVTPFTPPVPVSPSSDYDWGPLAGARDTPVHAAGQDAPAVDSLSNALSGFSEATHEASDEELPARDPFLEKSPQELAAFLGSAPVEHVLGNDPVPAERAAAPESTPSFLTQKPSTSPRANRLWRGVILMACLLLSLALGVQVLMQERDRIAATLPALKPLVEAVCAASGCQIAAFRHIDAVVIDSSSFAKAGALSYKLQFTVKNVGTVAVATPALELSLTDTQDRTLVRRVVRAQEFDSRQGTLRPGTELTATLPIQVRLGAGSEKIAGYRLLAFYP